MFVAIVHNDNTYYYRVLNMISHLVDSRSAIVAASRISLYESETLSVIAKSGMREIRVQVNWTIVCSLGHSLSWDKKLIQCPERSRIRGALIRGRAWREGHNYSPYVVDINLSQESHGELDGYLFFTESSRLEILLIAQ